MKNQSTNPYDYLRSSYKGEANEVPDPSRLRISGEHETIDILSSQIEPGVFVSGFIVYWADGRISQKIPSTAYGVFPSERESRLWVIGYMLTYKQHFTDDVVSQLRQQERILAQQVLF